MLKIQLRGIYGCRRWDIFIVVASHSDPSLPPPPGHGSISNIGCKYAFAVSASLRLFSNFFEKKKKKKKTVSFVSFDPFSRYEKETVETKGDTGFENYPRYRQSRY